MELETVLNYGSWGEGKIIGRGFAKTDVRTDGQTLWDMEVK